MSPIELQEGKTCLFCSTSTIDKLKYGPLYQLEDVTAHYYCVLLSTRMRQKGSDEDGLFGFLLSDIKAELKRCKNIRCCYCRAKGATIMCCNIKCKSSFHLPCGLKINTMHQFFDQFQSFCHKHRTVQNIPQHILEEAEKLEICCYICFESLNVRDDIGTLWAPCCKRTWYHKICVQKMALSAGYFFKCAKCSDQEKFPKCMQQFGIYIPQQDASWELEPNAFEDLNFRYNNCDALVCRCPYGRDKSFKKTSWEIILCESCGSQGMHKACGNLKLIKTEWECSLCKSVSKKKDLVDITIDKKLKKTENETTPASSTTGTQSQRKKKRKRFSENSENLEDSLLDKRKRKRCSEGDICRNSSNMEGIHKEVNGVDSDGSDEILDVDTIEVTNQSNVHEVLSKMKPGPLSYKLALIRKEIGYSSQTSEEEEEEEEEEEVLVDLISDSDSDIEVVELGNSSDENKKDQDDGGVTLVWENKSRKFANIQKANSICNSNGNGSSSSSSSSSSTEKRRDAEMNGPTGGFATEDDDVSVTKILPRRNHSVEANGMPTPRMVSVIVSGVDRTVPSLKVNIGNNNTKEPPPVG